jgi:hypothetical protein
MGAYLQGRRTQNQYAIGSDVSTSNNWEMRLYKLLKESRDDVSDVLGDIQQKWGGYRQDRIDYQENLLREIDNALEEFEEDRSIET